MTTLEVYELDLWNMDGTNIDAQTYFTEKEVARKEALRLCRLYGVRQVRLWHVEWIGANPDDQNQRPWRHTPIVLIETNDAELQRYLELREKFKNLDVDALLRQATEKA